METITKSRGDPGQEEISSYHKLHSCFVPGVQKPGLHISKPLFSVSWDDSIPIPLTPSPSWGLFERNCKVSAGLTRAFVLWGLSKPLGHATDLQTMVLGHCSHTAHCTRTSFHLTSSRKLSPTLLSTLPLPVSSNRGD